MYESYNGLLVLRQEANPSHYAPHLQTFTKVVTTKIKQHAE
jgi:hypothetical protein